ncbi:M14 family metallocarboxypeptidase [Candidatus Poribacteria bacterium]|nr:M14 family metallocarboxypeptidase [Candidatus Poribacteria bacterium]MYK16585.1 M14 family metallocarboxypeptidase [Candidatus Poribacteria bacterium]
MRDYTEITERLKRLDVSMALLRTAHGYPIHQICLASPSAQAARQVLITGGMHGDEPAGVEAVLQFLERDNTPLLKNFSFLVIPCINPYGYVHNTRETFDGVDINRAFEAEDIAEVAIVKQALGQTQFSLAIDFHEDYDATGFYLYEGKRDEKYIGPELAAAAKAVGPIDPDDPGEDAPDLAEGVYKVATSWGTQGLTPYLLHFHSEHVIISETPTVWELQQRASLHLTILDTALNILSERDV